MIEYLRSMIVASGCFSNKSKESFALVSFIVRLCVYFMLFGCIWSFGSGFKFKSTAEVPTKVIVHGPGGVFSYM